MSHRVPEGPILPHSEFGDLECCGTLRRLVRKQEPGVANIICNECAVIISTVPIADLHQTLRKMEFTLDMCSAKCPHCGKENVFTGFSEMLAYTCRHRGRAVDTS